MCAVDIIICTRNRGWLIQPLLSNLEGQSLQPRMVVIVDSSDVPYAHTSDSCGLSTVLLRSAVQSLAHQRNVGLEYVFASTSPPDFVAFLDDDVIPSQNYLEDLTGFLVSHPETCVGCSGVDGHARRHRSLFARLYLRLFGLDTPKQGKVLRTGFNSAVLSSGNPVLVEWMFGCSVWRSQAIRGAKFRGDFRESSLGEDVEFSYRARSRGDLYVLPSVRLTHSLEEVGRDSGFLHGYRLIRSRKEIARLTTWSKLSTLFWLWGALGQASVFLLGAMRNGSEHRMESRRAAWGAFLGIAEALVGKSMR